MQPLSSVAGQVGRSRIGTNFVSIAQRRYPPQVSITNERITDILLVIAKWDVNCKNILLTSPTYPDYHTCIASEPNSNKQQLTGGHTATSSIEARMKRRRSNLKFGLEVWTVRHKQIANARVLCHEARKRDNQTMIFTICRNTAVDLTKQTQIITAAPDATQSTEGNH